MFDLIIKGGRIADGSGAQMRTGDIAVENGRIAEIGGRIAASAHRVVEADGALVTPGFIDLHSHYDGQATWDDKMDPSFSNGVTSTIMGNCGVGFAPVKPRDRDRLIAVMEGVEAIPGVVLKEGIPWAWESFTEYMDFLGRRRFAIDLGVLVAHAPLRVLAMGERAVRHEQATAADLEIMVNGVREAMAGGALGLSSGRITEHTYGEDRANVPGTFAEHDELFALAHAVTESGRGLFQMVPRGTIGGAMGAALTKEARIAEHRLLENVARITGRPVHYLVTQFDTDPDDWRMMLNETVRARAAGLPIYLHFPARGFGLMAGLDGYHNFVARPAYREIAHLPRALRAAAMREPSRRAAILGERDLPQAHLPDGMGFWAMAQMLHARAPIGFLFNDDSVDYEPGPERSIGAIAQHTHKNPIEIIYDHMAAGDGRGLVAQMLLNYSNGNLDHVYDLLQQPGALSSLGDGGAHVNLICDASMMPFHLSFWGRDRKRGPTLPVEKLVAKITADNARAYGLTDRGVLAVGKRADINVMNFDRLNLTLPQMVHDLPSGGARLDQPTTGFIATVLHGIMTREHDEDTGERPGRVIRGASADPFCALDRSRAAPEAHAA